MDTGVTANCWLLILDDFGDMEVMEDEWRWRNFWFCYSLHGADLQTWCPILDPYPAVTTLGRLLFPCHDLRPAKKSKSLLLPLLIITYIYIHLTKYKYIYIYTWYLWKVTHVATLLWLASYRVTSCDLQHPRSTNRLEASRVGAAGIPADMVLAPSKRCFAAGLWQ